jgi:HSP90 family molecular chaperone
MNKDCDFQGEIRVASRIIDYLSSGLYQSPAACLKELINNAYDADASEVQVLVKSDDDFIIIEDNGHGLDRHDFERHFVMISESFKREQTT